MEFGEERLVSQIGDDNPFELHAERSQDLLHEIVGHRAGRLDLFERQRNRLRLRTTDEDRQEPLGATLLFQKHDWRVAWEFNSHAN